MGKQAFPARGKLLQAPALCRKKWREALAVQSEPARRGESEGGTLAGPSARLKNPVTTATKSRAAISLTAGLRTQDFSPIPSYEGSSVKHQNLSLSGRKPNSDLSRRVLRQPRIRWDISSQTTFPYSGEEFFSGGATL